MEPVKDESHFQEPIADVGKTTKSIIFGRYRKKAISLIVLSVVWFFAAIIFLGLINYSGDGVLVFALLPTIFFGGWWWSIHEKVRSAFMSQFAQRNGFKFEAKQSGSALEKGLSFGFGHSKKMFNIVSGEIGGYPIRLYNYQTTTGYGKNSQNHQFTMFEMTAKNEIPQLFLNSKKAPFMNGVNSPVKLSDSNILKLEGDFNQYFDLYVPVQYEQEALQIFTPEIMAELIDTSQGYDMEIVGRQVRIITNKFIEDIKTLDEMHNHAKRLVQLFEKLLSKFKFELVGDFSPQLSPRLPFFERHAIVFFVIVVVLLVLTIPYFWREL